MYRNRVSQYPIRFHFNWFNHRHRLIFSGNTGLGYVTCLELIRKGAKVYLACRSEARATDAINRLLVEVPEAKERVFFLPFDLTELKSATAAAEEIIKKENRLDVIGKLFYPN